MSHRPILVQDLSLSFPHKVCFENFSTAVHPGERIAIIGHNGSGKSHLMRLLMENATGAKVGYVPQIIEEHGVLSGGERFNKVLSDALSQDPDLLCLDEPTNHLDSHNRRSLMRMLDRYRGTLIVITHDVELLRRGFDLLWHLHDGRVKLSRGSYDDYVDRQRSMRESLESDLNSLKTERRQNHQDLMRDQERAKKKKTHGEKKYEGDKLALRSAQGRGQLTTNKNRKRLGSDKDSILASLADIRIPEIIKPTFTFCAVKDGARAPLVRVSNGACGYSHIVLRDLRLQLSFGDRVWITGANGSGKTTLVRAILGEGQVIREGRWYVPAQEEIGYLDQHYNNLNKDLSALELMQEAAPHFKLSGIREHLNRYLLRKNEEVMLKSRFLSGGEKVRLLLAQIGIKTPKLLILDELTNNLDLETREHVIQVLRAFPGALILISHDSDFVDQIGGCRIFECA
jgi:ATPase subunit of ABC transporter with duplicated ATPase domains